MSDQAVRTRVSSNVAIPVPRHAATTARSWRLVKAFRHEQSRPELFYALLADDAVSQISAYAELSGAAALDVGGGPGFFAEAFERSGAWYTALDADAGEFALHGQTPAPGSVLGDGMALPFKNDSFDICYSSNVAEHVAQPWVLADEMLRVTKPGGFAFLSYTAWFGPWGGHETSPWHYLGGDWAAQRYRRKYGRAPKNVFGTSMFAVKISDGLHWAHSQRQAEVVAAIPRYLPSYLWSVVRVPGLREVLTWNLMLVLKKL